MTMKADYVKYHIDNSSGGFEQTLNALKQQLEQGTQNIELKGVGTHTTTVIKVAESLVNQGFATWEKLNTDSILPTDQQVVREGDAKQKKKVQVTAIIKNALTKK